MPDMTLDDLPNRWTQVARRGQPTPHTDGWEWNLPRADVSALHVEVAVGTVLKSSTKDAAGREIVVAKRVRKPDPAERFAVMGRELFKQ